MRDNQERLLSLDVLRGMDMFLLTVIGPLVWVVNEIHALPNPLLYQFTHPWEGFALWDMIMPCFLFMCGAAIPLSLERRLVDGRPGPGFWFHVFKRVAMLWVLGLLVQGQLLSWDLMNIRPYNNTLQTIAAGYLITAVVILIPSMKLRIAVAIAFFVLYGALVHFLGDYTMTGNFAEICEQKTLAALLPEGHKALHELGPLGYLEQLPDGSWINRLGETGEIHYTWILTTLMFGFMTLFGYFSQKILQGTCAASIRALRLFALGVFALAIGWLLALCGVKVVKHIFTVSFTAQAMGWCAIALAVLYWIVDGLGFYHGLSPFVLFGRASLLAYVLGEFFWPCLTYVGEFLSVGVAERWKGLVAWGIAEVMLVGALWLRNKWRMMKLHYEDADAEIC